jgi:hypothetical protein
MTSKYISGTIGMLAAVSMAAPTASVGATSGGNVTVSTFDALTESVECKLDQLHVIRKPSGVTYKWPTHSLFHPTVACEPMPPRRLADDFETRVEVTGDMIDVTAGPEGGPLGDLPDHPPQFRDLWDAVQEGCQNSVCRSEATEAKMVRHLTDNRSVTIRVEGTFDSSSPGTEMRDHFFELVRQAFDRGVVTDEYYNDRRDRGPMHLYASGPPGDYSGYSILVEFSDDDGDDGCNEVVDGINSFGALVPHLGPFFGFAGAVCGLL